MVPVRGHVTVQRSKVKVTRRSNLMLWFLIINYKAVYCKLLALLNVGMTFRLTTILGDFDKMTCLCMGGT